MYKGFQNEKESAKLLREKRFADIFYKSNSTGQLTWRCKEEEYQAKMNKELKRKLLKNSEKGSIQSDILNHHILKNKTLDELWDIIKSSIKKPATSKLSQKKKTHVVENISYIDAENKSSERIFEH
ncbi:7054_t:CDS:2 [Gigaspora margarita]|uniref:7054_t:CDS:1 n=1 Tax=Gigaspora margarita TaxID=4874 RepID=A0ABN7V9E2_GIGMA|nr:7054_t:CDS:2 [Gigaspora margarita]